MTSVSGAAKPETGDEVSRPEMVTLTIDGAEISVPKGTLVIRAAELMGVRGISFTHELSLSLRCNALGYVGR